MELLDDIPIVGFQRTDILEIPLDNVGVLVNAVELCGAALFYQLIDRDRLYQSCLVACKTRNSFTEHVRKNYRQDHDWTSELTKTTLKQWHT